MNKNIAVNMLSLLLSVSAIGAAMLALKHSFDMPQAMTMTSPVSSVSESRDHDACLALDKAVTDLQTAMSALTDKDNEDMRKHLRVELRNKRDLQLSLHCKAY